MIIGPAKIHQSNPPIASRNPTDLMYKNKMFNIRVSLGRVYASYGENITSVFGYLAASG
jgi:hypothetical protein